LTEEDKVEVAVLGKTVYVRPTGYATQAVSLGLPDFLDAMLQEGCTSVTFDLGQCRAMDSTFMGVIAGAAMARPQARGKLVAIVNAGERTLQQLAFIGLLPVVAVVAGAVEMSQGLRLAQVGTLHWPKTERERILKIKRLHQNLLELNDKNEGRFGPILKMLEAELQQQEDRRQ